MAIRYARSHLAQWAEAYEAEHQRACALLAFSGTTGCSRYAGLLDDSRWGALVRLFHGDLFRLHSMPPVSLLNVHLQARLQHRQPGRVLMCCRPQLATSMATAGSSVGTSGHRLSDKRCRGYSLEAFFACTPERSCHFRHCRQLVADGAQVTSLQVKQVACVCTTSSSRDWQCKSAGRTGRAEDVAEPSGRWQPRGSAAPGVIPCPGTTAALRQACAQQAGVLHHAGANERGQPAARDAGRQRLLRARCQSQCCAAWWSVRVPNHRRGPRSRKCYASCPMHRVPPERLT